MCGTRPSQVVKGVLALTFAQHVGMNVDSSKQEVQSFSKTTDVHKLAIELEDKLPEE